MKKNTIYIAIIIMFIVSCSSTPAPTIEDSVFHKTYNNLYIAENSNRFNIKKVAILPFANLSKKNDGSERLARQALFVRLNQLAKYDLVDNQKTDNFTKTEGNKSGVFPNALKIGRRLKVDGVIVGSIGNYGKKKSVGISIRLIDIKNEKIVWSFSCNNLDYMTNIKTEEGIKRVSIFDDLYRSWKENNDYVKHGIILHSLNIKSLFSQIEIKFKKYREQKIKEYIIYKSRANPDGNYIEIARFSDSTNYKDNTLSYNDTNVKPEVKYYYIYEAVTYDGFLSPATEYAAVLVKTKPEPVRNLKINIDTVRKIKLNWDISNDSEVMGYKLYRKESENEKYKLIKTIKDKTINEYIDGKKKIENLKDKTTYYYHISAYYDFSHESERSNIVYATTPDKPYPPKDFTAEGGGVKKITLKWISDNDIYTKGYILYRKDSDKEKEWKLLKKIKGKSTNTFVDENSFFSFKSSSLKLTDGTTYYYKISSYNVIDVESTSSEPVYNTTKYVPSVVTGVNVINNIDIKKITLQWNLNSEKDIESYNILRADKKKGKFKKIDSVPSSKNIYENKNLDDGALFYYKIQAVDKDDLHSKLSTVVKGNTKPKPSIPKKIVAKIENNKIVLTWDINPEKDIINYNIYRDKFFGSEKIGSTKKNIYEDIKIEKDKKYSYSITAVDKDNLESERSLKVTVLIPIYSEDEKEK